MPGRLLRILAIPALIGCCTPLTLGARPLGLDLNSQSVIIPPDIGWFPEPFPPSGNIWEIIAPNPIPNFPEWFRSHTDLPDEPEHTDLPDEPEATILPLDDFHFVQPVTVWDDNAADLLADLLSPVQPLPMPLPTDGSPFTGNTTDRDLPIPAIPTSSAIPSPGGAVLFGLIGAVAIRTRRR